MGAQDTIRDCSATAQLLALNALFDAARAGEAARQEALFIAFGADVSSELARMQLQDVLDALCAPDAQSGAALLLDDMQHFSQGLQRRLNA